jgi:hypothetical protein
MDKRMVDHCGMCGHFLAAFDLGEIKGWCDHVKETDLSEYPYKIIYDPKEVQEWCPLPNYNHPVKKKVKKE